MKNCLILLPLLFLSSLKTQAQLLYSEEAENFDAKYYPKRIQEFDRMIASDSTQIAYYYRRAELKYKLKRYSDCIADYNLILKRFGERYDTYANLGMAYCFLNDSVRSVQNLQKAVAMNLPYARNHMNLGFVYLYFGNYTEAIPHLKKAVELDQSYAKAFYYLGYAYLISGDLEESKKNLLKSIELAEINPDGYYNLGVIFFRQGNYREAVSNFTKSLDFQPTLASNKELFLLRGKAYEKLGENEKAKADLDRAEALSGTH